MRATSFAPLLSLLLTSSAFAQAVAPVAGPAAVPASEDEPQTIIHDRSTRPTAITGWFVAPSFATTGFGGELAYSPGIRGGLYLNRRLAIGVAANGIFSDATYVGENDAGNFGTYGGLLLQYVVQSNRVVHATFESTIGSGNWCAYTGNTGKELDCTGKDFLVFEPAANVELNVVRHLRIATGVGYRFAVAGSGVGPSSRDMSSLVVRTALVFGSF
jgi:hypothetical protein